MMRKGKKIALLVAAALILFGAALSVAAGAMMDFHPDNLSTVQFQTTIYEFAEEISGIEIQGESCNVQLMPSEDDICTVVCRDNENVKYAAEVKDGILCIDRVDNSKWYMNIGFYWGEIMELTVYLPQDEYETFSIEIVSGDVNIPAGITFGSARITSVSGEVCFAGDVRENLHVESTSGDVKLKNVTSGILDVSTTSGEIAVSNVTADSVAVSSTSGEIEMEMVTAANILNASAVSGDLDLTDVDAPELNFQTVSGNVRAKLRTDKHIYTYTESGSVGVPITEQENGMCNVETTSGNIDITILNP